MSIYTLNTDLKNASNIPIGRLHSTLVEIGIWVCIYKAQNKALQALSYEILQVRYIKGLST